MVPTTVFHGTLQEKFELTVAIEHNCGCAFDPSSGARTSTCSPHAALVGEQTYLDHMLFGRHLAERLLCEEWMTVWHST